MLPLAGVAKELYSTRDLSERETRQMYQRMLLEGCQHADEVWHQLPGTPEKGYWGGGKSGEDGTRANAGMVLASAAQLKYSDSLTAAERRELLRKALASVRFATATHIGGAGKCTDGKQWGNNWQSAFWTSTATFGAWLIWDDMDARLQQDVKRVVIFEADRFLKIKPPTQAYNDTKAEENGWDVTCIALAPAMFPDHPHAAAWREKAIEYLVNTLSAPQDKDDATVVGGASRERLVCRRQPSSRFHPGESRHLSSLVRRVQFLLSDGNNHVLHILAATGASGSGPSPG